MILAMKTALFTVLSSCLIISACHSISQSSNIAVDSGKTVSVPWGGERITNPTKPDGFADRWYSEIYPALQKTYGGVVSRSVYDRWRETYFQQQIVLPTMRRAINAADMREVFLYATAKQPSN